MTFNIYTFLKSRPLSWSAISSFEWDPEQWYRRYILNEKTLDTAAMKFGKEIGKKIETDPQFLPHVPRYSKMEHKWDVMFGKIHCIGFADSFCDVTNSKLIEIKTGKDWSQKKVDGWGQITFYCLLNFITNEVRPEDVKINLVWLPTRETGDFNVSFIEPIKKTTKIFETKRTMVDVLNFAARVKDIILEMEQYVKNKRSS